MNVCDPIADLLTRIRNAQAAKHETCSVPASKMKIAITHILAREGFVKGYRCIRDQKQGLIKVVLKYRDDGVGVIQGIKRVSRPGLRRYCQAEKIPYIKNGFGVAILTTSKGIMTDKEARTHRLGGEYLCSVF